MHLSTIRLKDFKNYKNVHLNFRSKIICFTGPNGAGKTNLLDAIHYISMTHSYFYRTDRYSVRNGQNEFVIDAEVLRNSDEESIRIEYNKSTGKSIYVNEGRLPRFSDHIGRWPSTFIAPDDKNLLYDGSMARRRFMDMSLSQMDAHYLRELQRYNKIIRHRDKSLKDMARSRSWNEIMLDSFDKQLEEPTRYIYEMRKTFAERLSKRFTEVYSKISGNREEMECIYKSQLSEQSMAEILKTNREKDKLLERTSAGLHKDDIKVTMNEKKADVYGSQGQLKSFVIALKLTQFYILRETCGVTPFVLLDDLFEKVDSMRLQAIVKLVNEISEGQVFITDTNVQRVRKLLSNIDASVELYEVNDNAVKLLSS